MDTPLARVQDHFLRVRYGERSRFGFPPELMPAVEVIAGNVSAAKRLGFDVKLSPYLETVLKMKGSSENYELCPEIALIPKFPFANS